MLTSLRIQNFRSIRDASVKLGQVNLFIGPNNSGKSNFLKGVELLGKIIGSDADTLGFPPPEFERMLIRKGGDDTAQTIRRRFEFDFHQPLEDADFTSETVFFNNPGKDKIETKSAKPIRVSLAGLSNRKYEAGEALPLPQSIKSHFTRIRIYQPDPAKFSRKAKPSFEPVLTANGSNLVTFLFSFSQSYGDEFDALVSDFRNCLGSLKRVATPPGPESKGYLKLKFFDESGADFWAEEVSESILYFLALLCIVHQPDPPKLLLLEEHEKGIHPRRIREVLDFIFELARLRYIQIILTSHSPYVVDHFADIPECISIFDRENGETVIRNAGDIISDTNGKLKAEGQKPICYSDSLGEHWVSGFLGGVSA